MDISFIQQSDSKRLLASRFLSNPLVQAWASHYFHHSRWLRRLRILLSLVLVIPLVDCVIYMAIGQMAATPHLAVGLLGKQCYKRQALETNESRTGEDSLYLLVVKSFNCEHDIYPALKLSLDWCRVWSAVTLFLLMVEFFVEQSAMAQTTRKGYSQLSPQ